MPDDDISQEREAPATPSDGGDVGEAEQEMEQVEAKLPKVDLKDLVTFVTDVRQQGSDEVIQLPVTRTSEKVQRAMRAQGARAVQGQVGGTTMNPSLDEYLAAVGRYYGKNPNYWERAGNDKVEVFEEVGKRTTKRTSTFWGWELKLFWELPFFDERLQAAIPSASDATSAQKPSQQGGDGGGEGGDNQQGDDDHAERKIQMLRGSQSVRRLHHVSYNVKYRQIETDGEWSKLVSDNPWSDHMRRRKTTEFLQVKMEHEDPEIQLEGIHGMWELATNQEYHLDITRTRVLGLVDALKSTDWRIVRCTAATIWALSTTSVHRHTFGSQGAVQLLLEILQELLKVKLVPEPQDGEEQVPLKTGQMYAKDRDEVQTMCTGALAIMLVDKTCREPLIALEPNLATFISMCGVLPDYSDEVTAERRVNTSRILCSLIQRDASIRRCIIEQGQLKAILGLMCASEGPGQMKLCFSMAAALATLVLDVDVMQLVRKRGEAPPMFDACLKLLERTLNVLEEDNGDMSPQHAVKLAEASGQASWGSAYECVQPDGGGVDANHIDLLTKLAFKVLDLTRYPLTRVLHCISATLATLSSTEEAAAVIMGCDEANPSHGPVPAMLKMVLLEKTGALTNTGHVRAAATTCLGFLAGHSFTSKGEECMVGPHRKQLLEQGALDKLLEAALTPDDVEISVFKVIQHSAAVGVMYLSTMAGTVSPKALAMLAALMQNSSNVEMVEYLMAAFWILLRNSGNRDLLSEAFAVNPLEEDELNKSNAEKEKGKKVKEQLKDVSNTNEVSDNVANAQRSLEQQFGGMHQDKEEEEDQPDDAEAGDADDKGEAATSEPKEADAGGAEAVDGAQEGDPEAAAAEGNKDGDAGSQDGAAAEATEAPKAKAAPKKALKKDWGLDILVQVGETWIDSLLESDDMTEGDAPLLKLFEFLVASLCLFLIDEDEPVKPRRVDVFEMGVPRGGRKRKTWWSIAAVPPGVEAREPPAVEKALSILCSLLKLKMYMGWKVVQLSTVSLWNCCARSESTEKLVVMQGAVETLINIANTEYWPPTVREAAAGHLMHMAEEWSNIQHVGGTSQIQAVMIKLILSKHPMLEMRAARYIGRMTCSTPYLQPKPKAAMSATKESIAKLGGITQLVKLATRCQKRYTILLTTSQVNFRPRGPSDSQGVQNAIPFEKDCNNLPATLECYYYTLCSLLNLSTLKTNQMLIAKKGLRVLLGIISYFSRQHGMLDAEQELEQKLYYLASSVVQNLSLHPKNRTAFYKAELKGSATLERELEDEGTAGQSFILTSKFTQMGNSLYSTIGSNIGPKLPPNPKSLLDPINNVRPKMQFTTISPGPSLVPSRVGTVQAMHPGTGDLGENAAEIADALEGAKKLNSFNEAAVQKVPSFYEEEEKDMSKDGFLKWYESYDDLRAFGKPPDISTLPSYARPMGQGKRHFDDEGNWLHDPKDLKGLPQLLRRPLSHLWEEPPEHSTRKGAQRWDPAISEFRQPKSSQKLGDVAGRLLTTQPPTEAADNLLQAAMDITTNGATEFSDEKLTVERPSTRQREGGRMALTRLLPDQSALNPVVEDGEEAPAELKWNDFSKVPLNVVMAPNRDRTIISFHNRDGIYDDPTTAKLAVFEAIDGSKVYQGLFPAYQLPNGKRAHFYFQGGAMVDEHEVMLLEPPARPSSIPAALQREFPMTEVLNKISRPPGSAPPFIPYKPVPALAPLPESHTLRVKQPDQLSAQAFGNLRADNVQFVVVCKRITTTKVSMQEEEVYVAPPEEKEPWELMKSIFKPRIKEADSKDFWDNDVVTNKMFERDWLHAISKEKFSGTICRENKANTNNDKPTDEECLKQVHGIFKKYYKQFYSCFLYYASVGSGSPFHIQLNSWTMFLDASNIPDVESQYIKRSDCDTLFIVSNYIADKKTPEAKVNDEHALMRFEFLEAIVRAGILKYGKGVHTVDVSEAVTKVFEDNILPSLTPYSSLWPNDFRETRLYTEECDNLLKSHSVLLKAMYSRYRLRPVGGGLRTKVLKLDGWLKLIDETSMLDSQFTLQDATQCYLWSRMAVIDELKDFTKYESMSFIDFLEALGRMADLKFIPAASDLRDAGYENPLEWALAREQLGDQEVEEGSIFKPRPSCGLSASKTRPLYTKLELLLECMFRRLFYDPAQPEAVYSKEAVLKMVKKIDKEMGS